MKTIEQHVAETLRRVQPRPGMYMGTKKITCLQQYIHGVMEGLSLAGAPRQETLFPLPLHAFLFSEYAARRFGFFGSTAGWKNMLLETCGGDEEKAFDRFYAVWDAYAALRPQQAYYASAPENRSLQAARAQGLAVQKISGGEWTVAEPQAKGVCLLRLTGDGQWMAAVENASAPRWTPLMQPGAVFVAREQAEQCVSRLLGPLSYKEIPPEIIQ